MRRELRALVMCASASLLVAIYLLRPGVAATESANISGTNPNALKQCLLVDGFIDDDGKVAHQQILIRGGEFTMGRNDTYPEEQPQRLASVEDFYIDSHEVTNAQFHAFVQATGYITNAERQPDPSLYPDISAEKMVAGSASFIKLEDRPKGQWRDWWKFIEGANWRQPAGPGSSIEGMDNYPVIHVSYLDAKAYAEWAGRQLPTEVQWEYAAQASTSLLGGNTWQGFFPLQDKALDGFSGIAPVMCYDADETGLFDMRGNVWELVSDVYDATLESRTTPVPTRVIKGGSYLCADNYCQRDRPESRQGQEEDFSSDHVGFRTVGPVLSDAAAQ